jgi:HK97 family phage major capsid protein
MPTLLELRAKRNTLVTEARALLDRAKGENRDLNAEETTSYEKLMTDQESIRSSIEREERQEKLDREMAESTRQAPRQNPGGGQSDEERSRSEYRAAFGRWLGLGKDGRLDPNEERALSAQTGAAGGYLMAPQEMVSTLIKSIDDDVFIRMLGTKYQVNSSDSLGAPSLDNDPADADWTAEITTVGEDTTMTFGKRELRPQLVTKLLKVSNRLMRNAAMGAEAIVTQRLAYKVGITHEKGFLTGTGAGQPLGVFTASSDGISTSRDVSTGNATNAITMDGLINAKYAIKAGYQRRASWIFHRDGIKSIAKLRDDSGASAGTGQYLWEPSKVANEPDRLLGSPVYQSEYAPNTFTTGLYVGLFGDFSFYWIADNLQVQLQRLVELYAATNQTGFIVRAETDGMPVLGEAFARVKLA